ncbi:PAAR-like protein [Chryseobacterium culicis]|uniref:LysM domain-containing protein n=1 Tax=Chryseobacterium culicis TaxID=680127 RepID=A0A2S9CMU9_CHRCI|nr:PAAR-like protein [Chryseobacterium culicis]PRB81837.1 hypothetical protein CQ022_19400 [Chryseobacterium culicis]PRB88492.1 hypothetical protein CQ033_18305 [Chryseobacterium culicis]
MKNYVTQKGDTFSSLARQFKLKNEGVLKTYHNLHCPPEDVMQEPVPGKTICIPEDPQLMANETQTQNISDASQEETTDEISSGEENPSEEQIKSEEQSSEKTNQQSDKEEKKDTKEGSGSTPHEGKYFIVQKGTVKCNQGFKFPKFKVTSHQKHYWNDEEGNADYLAVTEDDLQLDPAAQPFGQCKLKPTSGGYLPCAYAPAGKWQKTYEKVKVMEKSCLTEISELMCSTGGKITILKHGQQSETSKSQVGKANTQEQQVYNPVIDFDAFKEDTKGTDELYYS